MGSIHREPRPRSPERLRVVSFDSASFEKDEDGYRGDVVTVKATFSYYTWCCSDSHEIADAVLALEKAIQSASIRAERKRSKKAQAEHRELLEEINAQRKV
jgi:hypothetical protein